MGELGRKMGEFGCKIGDVGFAITGRGVPRLGSDGNVMTERFDGCVMTGRRTVGVGDLMGIFEGFIGGEIIILGRFDGATLTDGMVIMGNDGETARLGVIITD
jgi:hypothetical protein